MTDLQNKNNHLWKFPWSPIGIDVLCISNPWHWNHHNILELSFSVNRENVGIATRIWNGGGEQHILSGFLQPTREEPPGTLGGEYESSLSFQAQLFNKHFHKLMYNVR